MESQAQRVEALKRNAKYRRHVLRKKKHERNMAQGRGHEEHRSHYRKRPEFDSHRVFAPQAKLKKVTSGRLSVPRGLFLKGRASSILRIPGDKYLNPLNYARKKEELGQIIKIGMDQAQNFDNQAHPKHKSTNNDPVKRVPEEAEGFNDESETIQEAKRKKNVDHIKTVLGLDEPGPSFRPSPTVDVQDTHFLVGDIPSPVCPSMETKSYQKNESPRQSPQDFESTHNLRTPDRAASQKSCNKLESEEKMDEMDDLYLEKLVSDIGLYAWNSQKPSSDPYENCDEKLIKEILSLREVSLNGIAKWNEANKAKQKLSETITSLHHGLPPKPAGFKLAVCDDEALTHWTSHKQTNFTTTKGKVRENILPAQRHSVEFNAPDDCCRNLFMSREVETSVGEGESTDDEPTGMMPIPQDFISPSTPPIAAHAFNPKVFMQDVEVERRPQEEVKYPPRAGCSAGGGCYNSRRFDRSEDEFNADDYETAQSQCYDAEASGRSDDSDISSNLFKYRRAMY